MPVHVVRRADLHTEQLRIGRSLTERIQRIVPLGDEYEIHTETLDEPPLEVR